MHIAYGNAEWYSNSERQFGSFLKKINMQQPYDPVIAHLSQINKDMCHIKTLTQRSKAALFVTRKSWG